MIFDMTTAQNKEDFSQRVNTFLDFITFLVFMLRLLTADDFIDFGSLFSHVPVKISALTV